MTTERRATPRRYARLFLAPFGSATDPIAPSGTRDWPGRGVGRATRRVPRDAVVAKSRRACTAKTIAMEPGSPYVPTLDDYVDVPRVDAIKTLGDDPLPPKMSVSSLLMQQSSVRSKRCGRFW